MYLSSASIRGANIAPRIIRVPTIEDLPEPNTDWSEGPITSSRWFLACGLGGNNIVWVHIIGHRAQEGPPVMHMGRELHTYPSSRCYVYARNMQCIDPAEGHWMRANNLMGSSLFLGINYPFSTMLRNQAVAVLQRQCLC